VRRQSERTSDGRGTVSGVALALYRKYRPRTFAEVIGQDHVTEPLIQALSSGRLNHAYLFSGPRGCGKTSSARILARSLNCEKGPTPTPCGECESCRTLAPDGPGSIDVIEIDAASHGGVDDARELRERAFFAPAISRYKIYIIDEAHMVSSAGFNALLKLVEEPPDYVKFVFATTEPEKVLGTIKSRTHHYPFRLIPPGVLRPYLEFLAQSEGIRVEPQVFPLVVRAGGGSARDALSVLDQLIAGSGPEGVTYARAVALLGVTDVALIDEMIDAIAAGDGGAAFATIDRVAEAGHDSRRFAGDLLQRVRDLIILRRIPEAPERGLIDAPDDEVARMRVQSGRLFDATLSRCADILHEGLVEMRGATSPRLLLELLVARMLLPAADESSSAVLQRLERLESGAFTPSSNVDPAFAGGRTHSGAAEPIGATSGQAAAGDERGDSAAGQRAAAGDERRDSAAGQRAAAGDERRDSAAGQRSAAGDEVDTEAASGRGATGRAAGRRAAAGDDDTDAASTSRRAATGSSATGRGPVAGDETDAGAAGGRRTPGSSAAGEDMGAPSGSADRRAAAGDGGQGDEDSGGWPGDSEADWPTDSGGGLGGGRAAAHEAASKAASRATASEVTNRAVPAPTRSPESAPPPAASTMDSGIDAASVRRVWDEIVRHVGQSSKKAAAFAREAVVREVEGDTLILLFKHKIHADGVNADPAPLLAAVSQVIGGSWRVRCEIGGDQRGGSASRPASAPTASSRGGSRSSTGGKAGGGAGARMSSAATSAVSAGTAATGTTSRVGGTRTGGTRTTAPNGGASQAPDEDWPTTARIGGAAAHDDEPPPTDEDVPYDPDFDSPPARSTHEPMHEGFDPGDEPDLDTDSLAVRQTGEEQALESLKQSFNLEKIAEKGS